MNKKITFLFFFIFFTFLSITESYADNCVANSSGNWENNSTWSCGHVPVAGDNITIESGVTVTVNQSHDLDMNGDPPTFITIEDGGFLVFAPTCGQGNCKIDFELADGSEIVVNGTDGITVNPLNWATVVKVRIGGNLILHGSNGANSFPFGPGTLTSLGPLPVELSEFRGQAMERSNMLKWQTASEENAMVFIVERSLDGVSDFKEIGRVNAFGNSTELRSYEVEDLNPITLGYYRLRIVDFDGTFEFSDIIAVERSKTDIELVEVFPIPAEDEVTVLIHTQKEGKAIITLSDFTGKKIKEEKVVLEGWINRYTLNWKEHETNFYYLTIDDGKEKIAKKILRASND